MSKQLEILKAVKRDLEAEQSIYLCNRARDISADMGVPEEGRNIQKKILAWMEKKGGQEIHPLPVMLDVALALYKREPDADFWWTRDERIYKLRTECLNDLIAELESTA